MTADTKLLLVRHGETEWNRRGKLQGWAPTPLTERGRQQARRLGDALAGEYRIDRLRSSDLFRTRETTAEIVAAGVDVEPVFDRSWRERDMGVCQGFTRETLHDQFPSLAIENGTVALEETPEGGESLVDLYDRVHTAWSELCGEAAGETVLVVTHGGPITVVLAALMELDLATAVERYSIGNCSLTAVRPGNGGLVRKNEQPFESLPGE